MFKMKEHKEYSISKQELGRRLLTEREIKGCTQAEAARNIGVSGNTLCNWECGNFYPKPVHIPLLAEFYGCTTDYLTSSETLFRTPKEEKAHHEIEALNKRIEFLIDKSSTAKRERDFLKSFYENYLGWEFFGWCGLKVFPNGAKEHLFIPASMRRVSRERMDAFMEEIERDFTAVIYGSEQVTVTDAAGETSDREYPEPDQNCTAEIDEHPKRISHGEFVPQYYIFKSDNGYHVLTVSELLSFADILKAFIQSGTQSMEERLPVLTGWDSPDSKTLRNDILDLYLSHMK